MSAQIAVPVVYGFCRWQWFVNSTSSYRKESPACEDKAMACIYKII